MPVPLSLLSRAAFAVVLALLLPAAASAQDDYTRHSVQIASTTEPLNGAARLLRPDGILEGEGTLKASLLEGEWAAFTSDGKKLVSITYRDGVRQGAVKVFFRASAGDAAGKVRMEGKMVDGAFEGSAASWHPSGSKRTQRTYAKGKLTAAQAWREDGDEAPAATASKIAEEDSKADLALVEACERVLRDVIAKGKRVAPGK